MSVDFKVFEAINKFAGHSAVLDQSVVFFTKFGPLLFGLFFVWLWFTSLGDRRANRKIVLFAFTIAVITIGIDKIIELSFFRERPFVNHDVTMLVDKLDTDPSFPSNHTAGSFALALALFWKRRKMGAVLLVFAGLMALSRIYTGVHYPTDVLVGAFIAAAVAFLVIWQRHLIEPLFNWILRLFTRRSSHAL
ncbi:MULTISPECIES: phosphatase PAP2 family protein [unclassified Sporosarcina]|uniref:phosphatase PAP2 family protein n=1 Tax=unclassified Sporosarcina TaxID=2647733 RepID=UPI00204074C6|nr:MULTISPECIES: phosphatase PAP2 family protein [unclassified Sporosarcina]GKV66585.1 undecaprenyl-diphosphatase [Sporosarcina sp. NCCP-2331]GLB56862.1 undecaprenyl-diphosphatase [Sporosarcina sp. NCCP-2378]